MNRPLVWLSVFFTLCMTLVSLGASVHAITYGEPDDEDHPNVGALIVEDPDTGDKEHICSGTLISPKSVVIYG
ncbi:hypothetical protein C8P63_102119 [Melghirimyces profundicolus]|uniref:Uncharacterized protein n=1 Tax=Melghirimyces profundicolus TaxID=1242148 RepID=A0A2T6C8I9_9BACL|nr:hypothetical protein [Melghirimyces profundicolus]PTX64625.1 hypothetical protein C8P63_102119 [Melghirimyces profundicolus]